MRVYNNKLPQTPLKKVRSRLDPNMSFGNESQPQSSYRELRSPDEPRFIKGTMNHLEPIAHLPGEMT